MFVLSQISDNVRLLPSELALPRADALTARLNMKYANKVLHNVGLCIRVFDIQSVSDAIVHSVQDGSSQTRVVFRLVVFRPFKGEVIVGKVTSSSQATGIRISLDFFDDIRIPPSNLPEGSEFDPDEGVWVWKYDGNNFYIDKDELIRFKVESEIFHDLGVSNSILASFSNGDSVNKPGNNNNIKNNANASNNNIKQDDISKNNKDAMDSEGSSDKLISPYSIVGTIYESGLGLTSWWT